jgi:hypothetical protein
MTLYTGSAELSIAAAQQQQSFEQARLSWLRLRKGFV